MALISQRLSSFAKLDFVTALDSPESRYVKIDLLAQAFGSREMKKIIRAIIVL